MKRDVIVIRPDGKVHQQSDPALQERRAATTARLEAEEERLAEAAQAKAEAEEAQRRERAERIRELRDRRRELVAELAEVRERLAEATADRARARALGDGGDLEDLRAEVTALLREEAEIEGACQILDAELAGLDRGVSYGGHRVIGG